MMGKPRWLSDLFERRLFWVAVGALLPASVALSVTAYQTLQSRQGDVLVISASGISEGMRTRLLATVGECLGRFDVEYSAESYEVRIPAANLGAEDYECLLRQTPEIGDLVEANDYYFPIPGKAKYWQGVTLGIRHH